MDNNFPGAIVVEAAKYGYPKGTRNNHPVAWVLHTPEEPPDENPSTPYYFHNLTDRNASTTYFVAWTGLVFQCVPEDEGAYANGVEGKPYPLWANSNINLNLQTLSIEIEGYASSIHLTMPRGSPQWVSLIRLMAHRCKELGIKPENTIGHYQVSNQRSDPGMLDINAIVEDINYLLKGDDMTPEQDSRMKRIEKELADIHMWLFEAGWVVKPPPDIPGNNAGFLAKHAIINNGH